MKNFKQSVIAVIAVAMIGSLTAVQTAGLHNRETDTDTETKINAVQKQNTITIAQKDVSETVKGTAEITVDSDDDDEEYDEADEEITTEDEETEAEDEEDRESEIAAKSFLPVAYIISWGETAEVKDAPSEEADSSDEISAGTQVQVAETSDGWCKIIYDNGKTGYVLKDYVTQNRSAANDAKMSIDNYKIGQISTDGGSVRVRTGASTASDVIGELEDGRYVYILDSDDDFLKVCYGSDYSEGYVIDTAVELTGEWENKQVIKDKQAEIKEVREAAARAEQIARQNASKAGISEENLTEIMTRSSGKGQDIVNTALQYAGVPYVWGGTSPSGFDCSGLVQYVCKQNGIKVSRVAADQRNCGTYVSRENLQPGDLVFFANGGGIHHVGIYIGNGEMIHAPHTGSYVKTDSINTEYRISQYAGAVRVW